MAINTEKLLPSAKGGSLAKIKGGMISSPSFIRKRSVSVNRTSELSQQYNDQNISIIQKSLIDVETLLRSVLTEDQRTEAAKKSRREREEAEKRETKLETPREKKKFNLPGVSLPGMSFLDRIKRFLFFTALGWLFTTFQSQLPKLVEIIKIITPIYGVVENIFKFILESVVSFIDRGYETYDKIRNLVKTVGGENAQKQFDNLSSKLNEYINYVLIGGMALTGAIIAFTKNVKNYRPPTPKPARGPRPRGPVDRIIRPAKAAAIKASRSVLGKQATRQLLRTVRGPLSRVPIVGGLIEFGLSWALGDSPGKAAFRGIGSTLLGGVGALVGSFPPLIPFGGPLIGSVLGGWAGAELSGKLYEMLFENKKPKPQSTQQQRNGGKVLNIRRYATGGQVLGGPGRTISVRRRSISNIEPQSTQPGKDVGGEKQIQRLYPDSVEPKEGNPWLKAILGRETTTITNPFRTLKRIAATFKQAPYGIGSLMGSSIDAALGQRISEGTLISISNGLESLFETINDKNYSYYENMFGKKSETPTFSNGNVVERTSGIVKTPEFNPKNLISSYIKSSVAQVVEIVRSELSLGKETPKKEEKEKSMDRTESSILMPGSTTPSGTDVGGAVVGYVGSTGRSSGPHIHIETGDGYSGKGGNIPGYVLSNIIVDGRPLSSYSQGDGLGAGRGHQGFDYAIRSGAPITLKGGLKFVEYDEGYNAGYGNSLIISDSSGRKYLIAHLSGGPSNPQKIKELQEKQKASQQVPLDQTRTSKITPEDGSVIKSGSSVASWYGPGFYGNRTADGTRLDRGSQWVAHKTLPLGTKVRFTYNGRSIVLPVKDRGPFIAGREWDLTESAAEAIGLKTGPSSGGGSVQYEILGKKGGGLIQSQKNSYIPKQSPNKNLSSLQSYPTYSRQRTVAIQPVIIREKIPMPIPT